jgi:hypothetical protein
MYVYMNEFKQNRVGVYMEDVPPVLLVAVLDATGMKDERPVFCTTKDTSDDVGSQFPNDGALTLYSLVESISFR